MKTKLLTLGAGILLLSIVSCKSTTEVDKDTTTEKASEEVFDATGYTSGTIVYSKEERDCAYTIQIKDGVTYDPINMDEEYTSFKKDGMKVYFKFRGLRMANRCSNANPIHLQEIRSAE